MKLAIGFLAILLAPGLAPAEVFKCTAGGKTVYSSSPCGADAAVVAMPKEPSKEQLEKDAAAARERQAKQEEAINQTLQGRRERAERRLKEAQEEAERREKSQAEAERKAIREGQPWIYIENP